MKTTAWWLTVGGGGGWGGGWDEDTPLRGRTHAGRAGLRSAGH